jgi:hypothetical protein
MPGWWWICEMPSAKNPKTSSSCKIQAVRFKL